VGESGSGKTTLGRAVRGCARHQREHPVQGTRIGSLHRRERRALSARSRRLQILLLPPTRR
jgi:ABC-type glutathione transport system ATPase component